MSVQGSIGLTGGIACGKSEVAGFLVQLCVPVLDTDSIAHALLEPGHWVYEKVVQTFGSEIVHEEGGIDRRKLGRSVFRNSEARKELNAIMHPPIFEEVDQWLIKTLKEYEYAVTMIPLLFETRSETRFEKVIVVVSDEKLVLDRLQARGLSSEDARLRIDAQMPVGEKVSRANSIIWNNGDLQDLKRETNLIWNKDILGKENKQ